MKQRIKNLLFFTFLLFSYLLACPHEGQTAIEINDTAKPILLQSKISYFLDKQHAFNLASVQKQTFESVKEGGVLNFGFTTAKVWLKFCVKNESDEEHLFLSVQQPAIDSLILFAKDRWGNWNVDSLGKYKEVSKRFVHSPDYVFPISIQKHETKTFYLAVSSNDQLQIPLFIGDQSALYQKSSLKNLFFGLYAGAVLIMMLYNFFISISTRDKSYVLYILYILFVGLTQALFQGYTYLYLWPSYPHIASYSSIIIPFFSGILTIAFVKSFLQTKHYVPKLDKGINVIVWLYVIALLAGVNNLFFGAIMLQICASFGALYVLFVAYRIRLLGYRPAMFFLLAFSLFFFSVILFVLRNFNVIPYTTVTSYILEIGSIIEISLLSFALADRINFYKKEKEISQARAMEMTRENARIINEQNVFLEREVTIRTADLEKANIELNEAMQSLKQAQAQLVESEKLASLGLLTAGIAHEINNPINFVTSNVRPLRRDVQQLIDAFDDLESIGLSTTTQEAKKDQYRRYREDIEFEYTKEEINALLNGIQEGAVRTAEIVKSLRVFSRVDEDDLKLADLNLGIESTLVILNSMIKDKISVEKHFGDLPYIECYPGKLNQVFLNLITNSIHAIEEKFDGRKEGKLIIKTYLQDERVKVSIKDNGIGISDAVKEKVFDPFFTTKEIGEGTGLGLAIVQQTVIKHQGQITLKTALNEGCEFIIELPLSQSKQIPFEEQERQER